MYADSSASRTCLKTCFAAIDTSVLWGAVQFMFTHDDGGFCGFAGISARNDGCYTDAAAECASCCSIRLCPSLRRSAPFR